MAIFYCLIWRLLQTGGPSPHIYIPQEQGRPVVPPGTGFPFRLLRIAGLQWRYSNPPPHGLYVSEVHVHNNNKSVRTSRRTGYRTPHGAQQFHRACLLRLWDIVSQFSVRLGKVHCKPCRTQSEKSGLSSTKKFLQLLDRVWQVLQ
jgi:hypothetical protein